MKKAVIGVVDTRLRAEIVVQELQRVGFLPSEISVLFPDTGGSQAFAHEQHTKAPEGAAAGAGAGGLLGGALGALVGAGALVIPGLGPFIAAGPIMAALSGLAAGATVGGFTGALVGMGVPEFEAKMYEGGLRAGNILVSVHTEAREQRSRAMRVFRQAGIVDAATQTEKATPQPQRR